MNLKTSSLLLVLILVLASPLFAESSVIAEDDASQSAYGGTWDNTKNGGSGFSAWTLTTEGNDNDRHSGFFIAETKNNQDLNGVQKSDKAFGIFANGSGFEQAVAYRAFEKPLQTGDSFSFMMENGSIVEHGSHAELLAAHGAYARLYQAQFAAPAADVA